MCSYYLLSSTSVKLLKMVGKCVALLMLYSYSRILGILGPQKRDNCVLSKLGKYARRRNTHESEVQDLSIKQPYERATASFESVRCSFLIEQSKQSTHYNYDLKRTVSTSQKNKSQDGENDLCSCFDGGCGIHPAH